VGGAAGASLAGGIRLSRGPIWLDLAIQTWGTLNLFASKGFGAGLGLGFRY